MAVKPMMGAETSGDEMDSMYQGSEGKPDAEEGNESIDQEEAEEMSEKAIIPMKVAMGKHTEPVHEGDEIVLKVTGVHGDQVEVQYSETPPGDIGEGEGAPGEEMSADDEIDGLDKSSY